MDIAKSDGEFQEECHRRIEDQLRETKINSLGGYMPRNVCKYVHDNILKSNKAYILDYFNFGVGDLNSTRVIYATNKIKEDSKEELNDELLAKELMKYHKQTVDGKAVYKFIRANEDRIKDMISR